MAELTLSLSRFLASPSLRGTPDELFAKALQTFHGQEKHTPAEWGALIQAIRDRPVTPSHLRQPMASAPRPPRRR